MESRPLPAGYQHTVTLSLSQRPPIGSTDALIGLMNLEAGWEFPLVEIAEENPKGYVALVSVFGESPEPTSQELAALEGCAAELRWADKQVIRRVD